MSRKRRRRRESWFGRLSMGKRIGVVLAGVLICLMMSGVVFVAAKLGRLDTQEIKTEDIVVNKEAEKAGKGYTNFAVFGIDSRSGELEKGTRSDTIIIASLNNKTKEVRMVSVYRDTLLNVGNGEIAKCNAAYSYGGPTQAINMLNENLDLNIQDFVTVDFAAVAEAIDLLGGVEIDIQPEEVRPMNKYISETARVADKEGNLIQQAGLQQLDGVQATTYARIRSTAGGDFKRAERQRLVIEKIVDKVQKSDLGTINKMIDELLPTIKTSLSATEILSYAKCFADYKLSESSGFPFAKTTDTISGLGSVAIPVTLEENVLELHQFLYVDKEEAGEDEEGYEPSEEVMRVNNKIESLVGPRTAMVEEKKEEPEEKEAEENTSAKMQFEVIE